MCDRNTVEAKAESKDTATPTVLPMTDEKCINFESGIDELDEFMKTGQGYSHIQYARGIAPKQKDEKPLFATEAKT